MKKEKIERGEPKMAISKDGRAINSPIVAYSPSYQQPVSEAMEMTAFALKQREVSRG